MDPRRDRLTRLDPRCFGLQALDVHPGGAPIPLWVVLMACGWPHPHCNASFWTQLRLASSMGRAAIGAESEHSWRPRCGLGDIDITNEGGSSGRATCQVEPHALLESGGEYVRCL